MRVRLDGSFVACEGCKQQARGSSEASQVLQPLVVASQEQALEVACAVVGVGFVVEAGLRAPIPWSLSERKRKY